jgi:hypothetical protein
MYLLYLEKDNLPWAKKKKSEKEKVKKSSALT